jgi:hypothetical protein
MSMLTATRMTSSRLDHETVALPRRWFLLAAGVAGCGPAKRTEMRFDTLTYTVSDMLEAPHVLTLKADGQATYWFRTNERLAERPGIGLYEVTFEAPVVRAVADMLTQAAFPTLPDHYGRIPESAPTRKVSVQNPAGEVTKEVSQVDPVDPRLQQVLSYLDGIVAQVMKSPRRVLHAALAAPAKSGDSLWAEFRFSNPGSEPVAFRSPSHVAAGGNGWFRLEAWPAVPRPGSLWAEQKVYVQPLQVQPATTDISPMPVLVLAPGASMRFRCGGPFMAPPGHQQARGSYCNFQERIGDVSVITGHLLTTKVDFDAP